MYQAPKEGEDPSNKYKKYKTHLDKGKMELKLPNFDTATRTKQRKDLISVGKKLRTDLGENSYEKYCERYALFQPELEVSDAEGDDDEH